MPGMLFHVALASYLKQILLEKRILTDNTVVDFFSGNLIPDLAEKKDLAHYEAMTEIEGVYSPDMEVIREKYFSTDSAVLLGVYCHLLLDNVFIEEGLIRRFEFCPDYGLIIKDNDRYTYRQFFGKHGIYGDYTKMNHMLIDDGWVDMNEVDSIPDELPLTGFYEMDKRRTMTWRQELEGYLYQRQITSYGLLEYKDILKIVRNTADMIINDLGK